MGSRLDFYVWTSETPLMNSADTLSDGHTLRGRETIDADRSRLESLEELVASSLGVQRGFVMLVAEASRDPSSPPRMPSEGVALLRWVLSHGEALVIEDAAHDPRFASELARTSLPSVRAFAGVPLRYRDGPTWGALAVVHDQPRSFSERDRAVLAHSAQLATQLLREQALASIKEVELSDSLEAAIAFVDEAGLVEWASRRATRLYGLTRGGSLLTLSSEPLTEMLTRAVSERRSVSGLRLQLAGGAGVGHAVALSLEPRDGGFVRCTFTDTDAETIRGHWSSRLESLVASSPELLATLNERGQLDNVNPSWQRVLGWSPEELRAQPLSWFVHPSDANSLRAMLEEPERYITGDQSTTCRLRTKSGLHRVLALSLSGRAGALGLAARDVTHESEVQERLAFNSQLNRALSELQREFIQEARAGSAWWERALALLIQLTGSEYGFIGSIHEDAQGRFLRTHAITNIAWDEPTRQLYEDSRAQGMEFRNLDTLFGRVIAEGRTLVSNDVEHDPRAHGRPAGHPPLHHFLGLACGQGEQLVGMVGLANRPSGYEREIVADLEAAAVVLAAVIHQSKAEARRALVEARLKGVVDSTLDVIVSIDRRGTILSINPAVEKVFGYAPSECIGRNVSMLMNRKERDEHDGYIERYLATGEAHVIGTGRQVQGLRKDGEQVHLELTVWTNAAEGGQSFSGLVRDVTARVNTERQLREGAAQLSTALSLAKAGHWQLDLSTNFFTFNDEFYKVFGTSAEEVGGYRLSAADYATRFVHPDDAAVVREEIGRALASLETSYSRDIEHRIVGPSGSVGYLAVQIRGARDADGVLRMLYGVAQDVSSRRQQEQERQQMLEQSRIARNLAARVAELDRARVASGLLTECVTFLQRAISATEGVEIISRYVQRMYPDANVAVYAVEPGTEELVLVTEQVRFGSVRWPDSIDPTDCWALRARAVYAVYDQGSHVPCRHCALQRSNVFLCAPLAGAECVLGLVTLAFPPGEPHDDGEGPMMREVSRFETMAQSLNGAMSTIVLRESLQRMALVDELTGLPNRRAFMSGAARILGRARRVRDTVIAAVFDVDGFKAINDGFGHDEGDRVLRRLSEIATGTFRHDDLIGRLGGEEFGIVLVGDEGGVRKRLEAFRVGVADAAIVRGRPVTISVGYAVASPDDAISLDALLKNADNELYRAKGGGRNCVRPEWS